jgi:cell division septum initiation protein DivIVA
MADLLDRICDELHGRLEELRPLVDEQRRLEAALQALGESSRTAPAAPAKAPSSARAARKPASGQPRKRAPRGANRDAVLRAVRAQPGATSAELASASRVGRNTLYALLARLVNEGALQTSKLPSGRTGYSLSEPPAGS